MGAQLWSSSPPQVKPDAHAAKPMHADHELSLGDTTETGPLLEDQTPCCLLATQCGGLFRTAGRLGRVCRPHAIVIVGQDLLGLLGTC